MTILTKNIDFFEQIPKKLETPKKNEKKSACGVTPSTRSIFFKITLFVTPPPELMHQRGGGTPTILHRRGGDLHYIAQNYSCSIGYPPPPVHYFRGGDSVRVNIS